MPSNLDRYKTDLELLVSKGGDLFNAMQAECFPEAFEKQLEKLGDKGKQYLKKLPSFNQSYQGWYSEAKVLVACRSKFVTAEAAGGVRVFPLDGTSIGGVSVDVATEFAS